MQTLGSFTLKHTFAPKQISSDPAGRRLAQCAGFFSPLPSLAQHRPQGQVPSPFSFLGRDPRPSAQSVTAPLLHALFRPLPRRAGYSPQIPGLGPAPRGAPRAEAAWAEDVRHGARGQREGGGTWKPGASRWQPRL